MRKFFYLSIFTTSIFCRIASAESISPDSLQSVLQELKAMKSTLHELTATVKEQKSRIDLLEGENSRLRTSMTVTTNQKSTKISGLAAMNPEIGLVADVLANSSRSSEDEEGNDRISLRELELIFGHDIDPYSRFDSTITFSDFESPGIEEAYITHWGLPWETKARLGRFRPKIGKASSVHRDQLDTADQPLVIQSYLGVEGLSKSGLELSNFIPFPWETSTHQLSLGVLEGGAGEEGALFGESLRRLSYYAHLSNFWEVGNSNNFELGTTYLLGSSDEDAKNEVNAIGLDATYIHHFGPINKLKWQNEAFFQHRSESEDSNPWGAYSLLDYRLSERFGIGARFDYVQPIDLEAESPRDSDKAYNAYVTFYQSEFARWRAQYQHVRFASGGEDDRALLQGTFAIGVHKHQLQ